MKRLFKMVTFMSLLTPFFWACSKEDKKEDPAPTSKTLTVTVSENTPGGEAKVENAEVIITTVNTITAFNAVTNKVKKTTNSKGQAVFNINDIKQQVGGSASANVYIWVQKEGTYLSNYYFGPSSFFYDDRVNSTTTIYVYNSLTYALTTPSKWMVARATVNSVAGALASCMTDNYVTFNLNNDYGRLQMNMYDGSNICSSPNPMWNDSTFRSVDGDSYVDVSGSPNLSGTIADFLQINKYNQPDSLLYDQISVSMTHTDSIVVYSWVSDNHGMANQQYGIRYYCYKVN